MKRPWMCVVLVGLGTAAALFWCVRQELARTNMEERQIKVIAHRGGAMRAPENTLAALQYAVMVGAEMVEMDLRLTKDGVPVALHDETLLRTAGVDRTVGEMNRWELEHLDVGGWFSPGFAGEKIPTLAQLLELSKGRIRLMLELKQTPDQVRLLEQTVLEIRRMEMEGECMLACTDLDLLRRAEELAPELEKIYLGEKMDETIWQAPYVDGYSICLSGVSLSDVERAHRARQKLYVWTVNDPLEMMGAAAMGVDGLVTDVPELAAAGLKD